MPIFKGDYISGTDDTYTYIKLQQRPEDGYIKY